MVTKWLPAVAARRVGGPIAAVPGDHRRGATIDDDGGESPAAGAPSIGIAVPPPDRPQSRRFRRPTAVSRPPGPVERPTGRTAPGVVLVGRE